MRFHACALEFESLEEGRAVEAVIEAARAWWRDSGYYKGLGPSEKALVDAVEALEEVEGE